MKLLYRDRMSVYDALLLFFYFYDLRTNHFNLL